MDLDITKKRFYPLAKAHEIAQLLSGSPTPDKTGLTYNEAGDEPDPWTYTVELSPERPEEFAAVAVYDEEGYIAGYWTS